MRKVDIRAEVKPDGMNWGPHCPDRSREQMTMKQEGSRRIPGEPGSLFSGSK